MAEGLVFTHDSITRAGNLQEQSFGLIRQLRETSVTLPSRWSPAETLLSPGPAPIRTVGEMVSMLGFTIWQEHHWEVNSASIQLRQATSVTPQSRGTLMETSSLPGKATFRMEMAMGFMLSDTMLQVPLRVVSFRSTASPLGTKSIQR